MNLKLTKITDKRAYGYCPFHKDTNPSFEVTLEGKHFGEYYCHGCHKAGKLTKPVMDQVLSHRGKVKKHAVNPVDWEELNKQYGNEWFWMKDPKPSPFVSSLPVLIFLDMGWDGEAFTFPTRNENNEIIGMQRRFPDGFKSMVDGSRIGLFIPQITFDPEQTILITEGISDLATVLECGYQGIGRFNDDAGQDIVTAWISKQNFSTNNIYIISDNDKAGINGSMRLAKELNMSELNAGHILMPTTKDIRQLKEEQGIESVTNWLKENIQ